MTSTPSDEPQVPSDSQSGGTPPPPPPSGYESAPPPATGGYAAAPPPAGGYSAGQPPAGGYGAPPTGGYSGAPAYGAGMAAPMSDSDQRMWATLAHIGGVLFNFVAPLIIWLIHKERGRFVEEQSKEALNFQITIAIGYVASSVLSVIGIGLVLAPLVWIVSLIFGIIAAIAANKGEAYRYPLSLRLIK